MDMQIIRTEKKVCSCCMEEHEVKTVRVKEHIDYKNIPIDYVATYYYCDEAQELFVEEAMMRSNDIAIKDAYRRAIGLLTSKEIRQVREFYGISQWDLCIVLGWGGKTLTRYEGHQVQDKAHNAILKKIANDPEWFLQMLEESKDDLQIDNYNKYFEKTMDLIHVKHLEEEEIRQKLEKAEAEIDVLRKRLSQYEDCQNVK